MVPFISLKLGYISVRLVRSAARKIPTISNHIYFFAEFRLAVLLSLSIYLFYSFFCCCFPPLSHCLSVLCEYELFMTLYRACRAYDVTVAGFCHFFFARPVLAAKCVQFLWNSCSVCVCCVGASSCFSHPPLNWLDFIFSMAVFPSARSNQAELSWMRVPTTPITKRSLRRLQPSR